MVKNPYMKMTDEELCKVIQDYQSSTVAGKRVESFVPHAKALFENLNLDVERYTIPLRECIDMSRKMFFEEVCDRFLQQHVVGNCGDEEKNDEKEKV